MGKQYEDLLQKTFNSQYNSIVVLAKFPISYEIFSFTLSDDNYDILVDLIKDLTNRVNYHQAWAVGA